MELESPGATTGAGPEDRPPAGSWKDAFAIDSRSLALFRILMGSILLADLLVRLGDLRVMYVDDGMFPRAKVMLHLTTAWNWSFHLWGGSAEYQALLFALAAAFAVALLAGFRTRLATIGSWMMLVSLHHRVPPILSGAEVLLRMLLFWAMFLPLNRAWSLDGWRERRRNGPGQTGCRAPVLSVGSGAILFQMAAMYLVSAVAKSNAQWFRGEVFEGALRHDFYASAGAAWLLPFPLLLKVSTWGTLALEWIGPFLLFFPRSPRVRLTVIALLAAMHAGIGIFLEVGLFSSVSLAGLSLFLPAAFWESRALSRFRFLAWPLGQDGAAQATTGGSPRWHRVSQAACALMLAYVSAVIVATLPGRPLGPFAPQNWKPFSRGLGVSQNWGMFGEVPSNDGWYVAWAKLKDGSEVDLLRDGAPLSWERPALPTAAYPNHYWKKLFREMTYFDGQGYQVWREPVAKYLCRDWNRRHPIEKHVEQFGFYLCSTDKLHPGPVPRSQMRSLVQLTFPNEYAPPIVGGYGDATR